MARATSKTTSYDVRSLVTGESRTLIERAFVKSERVAGGYLTASKEYALFDASGRRYKRLSQNVVECSNNGEKFHIAGRAESIRKTS